MGSIHRSIAIRWISPGILALAFVTLLVSAACEAAHEGPTVSPPPDARSGSRSDVPELDARSGDGSIARDGARPDAGGRIDAGGSDLGGPDAAPDAGPPDAAPEDAALPDAAPPPPVFVDPGPAQAPVILLSGQSNMVGLGISAELPRAQARPQTRIIIHPEGHLDPRVSGSWRSLSAIFGVDQAHFGPELMFGLELEASRPGVVWSLIKNAQGGSSLHTDWDPDRGPLYGRFVDHIGRAVATLPAPAEIVGLLWMQGESDAIDGGDARRYQARLAAFLRRIRRDLARPELPVVIALISTAELWPQHEIVRAAQRAVAAELENVAIVETADLSRHPDDPAHYDTAGSLALGRRFARALEPLLPVGHGYPAEFSGEAESGGWSYLTWSGGRYQPMRWSGSMWVGEDELCLVRGDAVHPCRAATEIRWTAPSAGVVTIRGQVAHLDTRCGNGITASINLDGVHRLWGPSDRPGDDATPLPFALRGPIVAGQRLGFRLEGRGDTDCDTSQWQIALELRQTE